MRRELRVCMSKGEKTRKTKLKIEGKVKLEKEARDALQEQSGTCSNKLGIRGFRKRQIHSKAIG